MSDAMGPKPPTPSASSGEGEDRAGNAAGASDAPAVGVEPVLNRAALDIFDARLPRERLASWLRSSIEEAETCSELLSRVWDDPEERVRQAHLLKGTTGLLGLSRISRIAGEIEDGSPGAQAREKVRELEAAIAATKEELRRSGFLGP